MSIVKIARRGLERHQHVDQDRLLLLEGAGQREPRVVVLEHVREHLLGGGAARGRGRPASLDRAFALPADHLEGLVAVPVDELAHRLERELRRQREVRDELLEALGPGALRRTR